MSIYTEVTERIVKMIEAEGALPWLKPWAAATPTNFVTGRRYRGGNRIILSLSEFDDMRFLTFKQALNLGGNVRKGERGTQIVLWKFDDDRRFETAEPKNRTKPLLRVYTIFSVKQCEGFDIPACCPTLTNREQRHVVAQATLDGMPETPRILTGGDAAFYSPSLDYIQIPKTTAFRSADDYWSVLFHEIAHYSGHPSRLNREGLSQFSRSNELRYGCEELVAQLTSEMVCSEIGIESTTQNSAAYLNSWIKTLRGDKSLLFRAAGQAEKASDYIFNRLAMASSEAA